jgi:hypothetical protein
MRAIWSLALQVLTRSYKQTSTLTSTMSSKYDRGRLPVQLVYDEQSRPSLPKNVEYVHSSAVTLLVVLYYWSYQRRLISRDMTS